MAQDDAATIRALARRVDELAEAVLWQQALPPVAVLLVGLFLPWADLITDDDEPAERLTLVGLLGTRADHEWDHPTWLYSLTLLVLAAVVVTMVTAVATAIWHSRIAAAVGIGAGWLVPLLSMLLAAVLSVTDFADGSSDVDEPLGAAAPGWWCLTIGAAAAAILLAHTRASTELLAPAR